MAKLPASIQIGPYLVTVTRGQAAIDRQSITSGSRLAGHFDPEAQRITLDPALGPDMLAETLLHEVMHGVSEAVGKPLGTDGEDEERMIRALAPVLLDTLRRNPSLAAFLLSDA